MLKLFCFVIFCSIVNAFLLDTNTPGTPSGLVAANNYAYILNLLMEERTARLQLQQLVVKQQGEIGTFSGFKDRIEKLENSTLMNTQAIATSDIHDKYMLLENKYNILQQTQITLSNELQASKNRTFELEREVTNLKQIKSINQLQALNNAQQQIQSLQQEVNSLKSNSQARGQDLVAMYNDVKENKKNFQTLDTKHQLLVQSVDRNISRLDKTYRAFSTNVSRDTNDLLNTQQTMDSKLQNAQQRISSNVQDISKLQQSVESEVKNLTEQIAANNEIVGFTAVGVEVGIKNSGTILKFPTVKSSFGITNLSTVTNSGIFTCEKPGIYNVVVTVMACSTGQSALGIYKSNNKVLSYYTGYDEDATRNCNSGTGTLLLQLNVGETVYVRTEYNNMQVYEEWSSFSVLKVN